jgi:TRAP-type mannitol/chloroaromatic compound transport system substrate-binding protein
MRRLYAEYVDARRKNNETVENLKYEQVAESVKKMVPKLREKHGVQILDTPKEFYPEFVKATNIVLDRYAAKDPFFKEVLDSQREFAKTVVPYWTKILDLYSELGNSALKK